MPRKKRMYRVFSTPILPPERAQEWNVPRDLRSWALGKIGRVSVPMELVSDKSLPSLCLRAYCIISHFAGGSVGGTADLDREIGQEIAGRNRDRWRAAVSALEQAGYIREVSEGKGERPLYRIEK